MDIPKYTDMDDHKVDGKVDWSAYRKAQIENGEICRKCLSHMTFSRGYSRLCPACKKLEEDDGEVWSDDYVRCPKCSTTWQPYESEQYELLGDGSHDVTCSNCDHDFTVSTSISWSFNSPPRVQEENGEEEEEDGEEPGGSLEDTSEEPDASVGQDAGDGEGQGGEVSP